MLKRTRTRLKKLVKGSGRKYPIRRDAQGRSARRRCFESFDRGMSPAEAALDVDVPKKTVLRYHAQWKKTPKGVELRYQTLTKVRRDDPEFSYVLKGVVAKELNMSMKQVSEYLSKPWGLHQLLWGRWPDHGDEAVDEGVRLGPEKRLKLALEMVVFCEDAGIDPEIMRDAIAGVTGERRQTKPSP